LHPWVTPPFDEPLTREMSFAANLGPELERAKLTTLADAIGEHFGIAPRVYKAGRYGIGQTTVPILEDLGFHIDQSVMPHTDFSAEHEPCFDAFDASPFVFGGRRPLLEIPCTSGYVGFAGPAVPAIYKAVSSPSLAWTRLGGIAARLRAAQRLVLSPEGFTGS